MIAYPAFILMSHSAAVFAQVVLGQLEVLYMSVILATYCEQLTVRMRASRFNLASILAEGTAAYIATWLIAATGNAKAPAWMLLAAAAVSLVTALTLRETSKLAPV